MCYSRSGQTSKGVKKKKKQKKKFRNQEGGLDCSAFEKALFYSKDFVFVSCGSLCKAERVNWKCLEPINMGSQGIQSSLAR